MLKRSWGVVAVTALAMLAACGTAPAPPRAESGMSTSASPTPSPSVSPAASPPEHVVVAIFENKADIQITASTAPYLTALIARSAVFVNARAVTHPSQPNYVALFSGSTHGVTDDHCPVRFTGQPNLARQLLDAGRTFTGYSEDLPSPGYRGCSHGGYAAKHNPWVDFDNVPDTANQPYTAWPKEFAQLPTVAFVVPDLCGDMHDCGIGTGDAWAARHLDPYLRWADTHRSRLVVTFDENDGSAGNQILTLVAGAGITAGPHTQAIDHYTVLRGIEDLFGLPPLGKAAAATPPAVLAAG